MDEGFDALDSFQGLLMDEVTAATKSRFFVDETIVTRKEIFSLSREERQRFVAAVQKLMENKAGPETSEWFRIAGYHGWPSDYCTHGEETFPCWHRAYLLEMETALRQADKELGNDGKISLPYWDWIENPKFPPIIRKHFSELPPNFFHPNGAGASITLDRRNSNETIALNLKNSNLDQLVQECLRVKEHWMHASTRWRRGSSLETPHNLVHVAVGYPMTTVAHAAFDPVFWLHHANVDRIHEAYLRRHQDSRQEFEATQQRLEQEHGEKNRFKGSLAPFVNPKIGQPFLPTDSFDSASLGYRYDDVMGPSFFDDVKQRSFGFLCGEVKNLPKTFCLFRNIRVLPLKKKSYILYVFLIPGKKTKKWNLSDSEGGDLVKNLVSMPEFAGVGAVFGGKASECSNCRTRKPYNVFVDVTEAMRRQGVSSIDECTVGVVTIDEDGRARLLEDTPIPLPELICDTISLDGSPLQLGSQGSETRIIQRHLSNSGNYSGDIDGNFSFRTEGALKLMQSFLGCKPDGVAGNYTKNALTHWKYDSMPSRTTCEKGETRALSLRTSSTMKFWLGVCPGYLSRKKALKELSDSLESWKEVTGADIHLVECEQDADIKIQFHDDINDDGIVGNLGGDLGRVGENHIHLDATQRWILAGDTNTGDKGFKFQPVVLHLLGHIIGFEHVENTSCVMHPLYNPTKTKLDSMDRQLLCSRAEF